MLDNFYSHLYSTSLAIFWWACRIFEQPLFFCKILKCIWQELLIELRVLQSEFSGTWLPTLLLACWASQFQRNYCAYPPWRDTPFHFMKKDRLVLVAMVFSVVVSQFGVLLACDLHRLRRWHILLRILKSLGTYLARRLNLLLVEGRWWYQDILHAPSTSFQVPYKWG